MCLSSDVAVATQTVHWITPHLDFILHQNHLQLQKFGVAFENNLDFNQHLENSLVLFIQLQRISQIRDFQLAKKTRSFFTCRLLYCSKHRLRCFGWLIMPLSDFSLCLTETGNQPNSVFINFLCVLELMIYGIILDKDPIIGNDLQEMVK